jgi:hypothetical protein
MGDRRLATIASALVLSLAILALMPSAASAGGHKDDGKHGNDASAGLSAPMSAAYPFPGVIVDPTYSACCYTLPILAVYQCPAVLVDQPGSRVVYLRTDPAYGLLGGQPYLYHH